MLQLIKKAIMAINGQYENGDITQQEVSQQLEGVLMVLKFFEQEIPKDFTQELKEINKLRKSIVSFIDKARRIY